MKLVITIVSNDDAMNVLNSLSAEGFYATRLNSTGQFLKNGHTTLLIGVDDSQTTAVIDIIKSHTSKRTVEQKGVASTIEGSLLAKPIEVSVGGAVVFVIDVESFERI